MCRQTRSAMTAAVSIGVATFFLSTLTSHLQAQRPSSGQAELRAIKTAEQDMMSREWNLTHIPDQVNNQFKKEQVSLFAQVNEDFTRIQVVNNNVMRTVFVSKVVDQKLISEGVAEIRKRALRLRQNLVLPRIPDEHKNEQYPEPQGDVQLKVSLLALDHSITIFVTNPLFKMRDAIESELALKAGRDLDAIIQSSNAIKKATERVRAANNQQ